MKNIIIISSYRPDYQLADLFGKLKEYGFENIIITDDGSGPSYSGLYSALEDEGAFVIHHPKNKGKGASIKDALTCAIKIFPDSPGVILADGDGQHTSGDILKISDALLKNKEAIILGTRNMKNKEIPSRYRRRNSFTSLLYQIDTGKNISDSQTGLRGIPHNLIPFAATVPGTRFEYETNLLKEASKKEIPFVEVEIKTVFPKGNPVYYRPIKDTARFLKSPLLFLTSSLGCSVVDIALFTIFAVLLDHRTANNIFTATILARLISATLNFILTRKFCFSDTVRKKTQIIKFLGFNTLQTFMSSTLVSLLSFIHIPLTLIKMLVDSVLFVLNYLVSKKWIFH